LVKQIDGDGNVTVNTYDAMNRKTVSERRMTDPAANDSKIRKGHY
jgi:hypothetical protein